MVRDGETQLRIADFGEQARADEFVGNRMWRRGGRRDADGIESLGDLCHIGTSPVVIDQAAHRVERSAYSFQVVTRLAMKTPSTTMPTSRNTAVRFWRLTCSMTRERMMSVQLPGSRCSQSFVAVDVCSSQAVMIPTCDPNGDRARSVFARCEELSASPPRQSVSSYRSASDRKMARAILQGAHCSPLPALSGGPHIDAESQGRGFSDSWPRWYKRVRKPRFMPDPCPSNWILLGWSPRGGLRGFPPTQTGATMSL
jgi:hypothetical protein